MADSIEKVIFAMRRDAVDAADPLNYFADRLAALPRAEWRPISEAPLRDAVAVHHEAHWTRMACLHESGEWRQWPSDSAADSLPYKPTHFYDLPPPPAKEST